MEVCNEQRSVSGGGNGTTPHHFMNQKNRPPVALPAPDDRPGQYDQSQISEGPLRLSFHTKQLHQEHFLKCFGERHSYGKNFVSESRTPFLCDAAADPAAVSRWSTLDGSTVQRTVASSGTEECHKTDEDLRSSVKVRPAIMRTVIQIEAIFQKNLSLTLYVPGFMWKERKGNTLNRSSLVLRWKGVTLFLTRFPLQVQFALTRSATKWHKHVLNLIYNITQCPQFL